MPVATGAVTYKLRYAQKIVLSMYLVTGLLVSKTTFDRSRSYLRFRFHENVATA